MTPERIEDIEELWEGADNAAKMDYLFRAVCKLHRKMDKFQVSITDGCHVRVSQCYANFISRRQAKVFAVIILALAVGIGLGSGYITASEIIKGAIGAAGQ
jgi:hypothetical protein